MERKNSSALGRRLGDLCAFLSVAAGHRRTQEGTGSIHTCTHHMHTHPMCTHAHTRHSVTHIHDTHTCVHLCTHTHSRHSVNSLYPPLRYPQPPPSSPLSSAGRGHGWTTLTPSSPCLQPPTPQRRVGPTSPSLFLGGRGFQACSKRPFQI